MEAGGTTRSLVPNQWVWAILAKRGLGVAGFSEARNGLSYCKPVQAAVSRGAATVMRQVMSVRPDASNAARAPPPE